MGYQSWTCTGFQGFEVTLLQARGVDEASALPPGVEDAQQEVWTPHRAAKCG